MSDLVQIYEFQPMKINIFALNLIHFVFSTQVRVVFFEVKDTFKKAIIIICSTADSFDEKIEKIASFK